MARAFHRHPRRALLDREITVERELHLLAEEEAEIVKDLQQIEADLSFGDYDPDDYIYDDGLDYEPKFDLIAV